MLILLILLAMEFVGVYLLNSLERYYVTAVSSNLTSQAQLLAGFLQRNFTPYPDKQYAQTMARQFGQQSGGAVVVLDASGALVSASVGDPASLARFLIQGEVAKALSGVRSELIRLDPETNERNLHVIVPITSEQQVLGLVYMISSLEDTYRTLGDIRYFLFTATGLAIGVTALVGWALARTITKPIEEVTKGAEIMSRGQFEASIAVRGRDEIGQLAQMFNLLGSRLRSTLDEIEEEKAKLETVLNSMTDGVIAVDPQNTVELANPAAGRFLAADTASLVGRPVEDVMSSLLTRDEIEAATSGGAVITKAIVSGSEDNTVLQVISASTRGEQGRSGTVFVLQDVTSQERLDSLRKEFVANVSHELKTPITTVKSYVETLIDGALVGGVARQFLEVILKETDRMSRLVRDLLDLSRIDYKQVAFDLRPVDPATLLRDSVRKLSVQAGNKGINLNIVAGETPAVLADWDRLQQVVLNVVANSIEFTPQGGSVTLEAAENGEMVTFRIADTGIGIPQADLPRIFERFYRVDKARSRQMGGTGLGLAIAKEIIDAHKGRIRIESQVGKGTVVTFELPVAKVADEYA
jgi:two-component system sensor histidine kinase VicK